MTEPASVARLVVLVSGSGSNLQALLDATADPAYGARVVAVGADRDGIAGLDRAAAAAVMLTAQANSAQAAMANLYELDAIAAAIIGGTLLSGGRGTIVGSLLGVLIFSTITNLFAINGLSTEAQNMVKGGIIVGAVLVQQVQFRSLTQFLGRNRATTT